MFLLTISLAWTEINKSNEKACCGREIAVEGFMVTVAIPAPHEAKESNSHPSPFEVTFLATASPRVSGSLVDALSSPLSPFAWPLL